LLGGIVASMVTSGALAVGGEKGTHLFEALMMLPFSRMTLTIAKWMVALLSSTVVTLITLSPLFIVAVASIQLPGRTASIAPSDMTIVFVATTALLTFAVAAGCFVGAFARSAREAGSFAALVGVAAPLIAVVLLIFDLDPTPGLLALPVFGPFLLIRAGIGSPLVLWQAGIVLGVNATLGALLIAGSARMLDHERSILPPQS
jgi:hypothetical protein